MIDAVSAIVVEAIPSPTKSTLKRRRRRYRPGEPAPIALLPEDWRALLLRWERRAPRTRWVTLLSEARNVEIETAHKLHDWLLDGGWVETLEEFERGRWVSRAIEFRHPGLLRRQLGLRDAEANAASWRTLASQGFEDSALNAAHNALAEVPPHVALRRRKLLVALASWSAEKRFGTRRDFALFARGGTKAITEAEWSWLAKELELETLGITRHAMTIDVRVPATLVTAAGRIDLGAAPDFISITASTITTADAFEGAFGAWRLVENRTSFERVARAQGDRDAVVWLPGYPPLAWRDAVSRLVAFHPAPAFIACDPDPDGIRIAGITGQIWTSQSCAWWPWRMDWQTLASLPQRKSLTARDRTQIEALLALPLPAVLRDLGQWMLQHGEKGEQEAYL